MSKQENYVRTQVRLDWLTHQMLKEYAEKTNFSMNAAINQLLHDALLEHMNDQDTQENRELFADIAKQRLKTLTTKEIRDICGLIVHISQLKGH